MLKCSKVCHQVSIIIIRPLLGFVALYPPEANYQVLPELASRRGKVYISGHEAARPDEEYGEEQVLGAQELAGHGLTRQVHAGLSR